MVEPATRFPIRGVIWYQGESNTVIPRAGLYERLLRTMIGDWRKRWGLGDFPFLYVQLAGFGADADSDWPAVREAQRRTLSVANTAMVQALDLGQQNDIHPDNKREVGRRLSLAARATVYGENVEYSGPLFQSLTLEPDGVRVWFSHAGGLKAKGGALRGFEVQGSDGQWETAAARIDGSTVVLYCEPSRRVRYAWANWPDANLFNAVGFPASPFSTE
jgi:sialate O-acetylesterase